MPLIVLIGPPCSGKTIYASKLKRYLTDEKKVNVIHINEECLGLNKVEYYENSNKEKMLRAKLKSEVEKWLDDKNFVILDSYNYIKGYRYELYCLVRNYKTTLCVIYISRDLDFCLQHNYKHIISNNNLVSKNDSVNTKLSNLDNSSNNKLLNECDKNITNIENLIYPIELLKDLYSRLEVPQAKNRWDSPLYQIYQEEEIPYNEVYDNLTIGKRPNYAVSTVPEKNYDSSYLQELDIVCNSVNNRVMTEQSNENNIIKIDNYCTIYLKKVFSGIELKKIKQEFLKICKMHPPKNKEETLKNYTNYVNTVQDRY